MAWTFLLVSAFVALLAVQKWRAAMYICIALDVLRDPVRKLSPDQPTIITVSIGVIWLLGLVGALTHDQRELRLLFRRYPALKTCFTALTISLLPGMLVSLTSYNSGWILAAIGTASYTAPFIGVILGYLWPRAITDVYGWMKVYVFINSLFLIGSILEWSGVPFPGLGALGDMKWIRYYGTDIIKLICGFYRSPDVMGIHAAHLMIFSALLAIRPQNRISWGWVLLIIWGFVSLMLCGRRKMIVIPIIAATAYISLVAHSTGRVALAFGLASALAVGAICYYLFGAETINENEYARFAGSIATESVERAGRSFTEILFTTISQAGLFGDGLGTVTQGRQYMGVVTNTKDWQEDGVGRLFKELGVPGVVFILLALWNLLLSIYQACLALPPGSQVNLLQFGCCGIIAANAASFSVSHQAYSGDPSTVLMVGFFTGLTLGLPRVHWARTRVRSPDIQLA